MKWWGNLYVCLPQSKTSGKWEHIEYFPTVHALAPGRHERQDPSISTGPICDKHNWCAVCGYVGEKHPKFFFLLEWAIRLHFYQPFSTVVGGRLLENLKIPSNVMKLFNCFFLRWPPKKVEKTPNAIVFFRVFLSYIGSHKNCFLI